MCLLAAQDSRRYNTVQYDMTTFYFFSSEGEHFALPSSLPLGLSGCGKLCCLVRCSLAALRLVAALGLHANRVIDNGVVNR